MPNTLPWVFTDFSGYTDLISLIGGFCLVYTYFNTSDYLKYKNGKIKKKPENFLNILDDCSNTIINLFGVFKEYLLSICTLTGSKHLFLIAKREQHISKSKPQSIKGIPEMLEQQRIDAKSFDKKINKIRVKINYLARQFLRYSDFFNSTRYLSVISFFIGIYSISLLLFIGFYFLPQHVYNFILIADYVVLFLLINCIVFDVIKSHHYFDLNIKNKSIKSLLDFLFEPSYFKAVLGLIGLGIFYFFLDSGFEPAYKLNEQITKIQFRDTNLVIFTLFVLCSGFLSYFSFNIIEEIVVIVVFIIVMSPNSVKLILSTSKDIFTIGYLDITSGFVNMASRLHNKALGILPEDNRTSIQRSNGDRIPIDEIEKNDS